MHLIVLVLLRTGHEGLHICCSNLIGVYLFVYIFVFIYMYDTILFQLYFVLIPLLVSDTIFLLTPSAVLVLVPCFAIRGKGVSLHHYILV